MLHYSQKQYHSACNSWSLSLILCIFAWLSGYLAMCPRWASIMLVVPPISSNTWALLHRLSSHRWILHLHHICIEYNFCFTLLLECNTTLNIPIKRTGVCLIPLTVHITTTWIASFLKNLAFHIPLTCITFVWQLYYLGCKYFTVILMAMYLCNLLHLGPIPTKS